MVKIGGIHNNNNNTVSFNPTYNQVYMDQLWSIGSKLEKKKGGAPSCENRGAPKE